MVKRAAIIFYQWQRIIIMKSLQQKLKEAISNKIGHVPNKQTIDALFNRWLPDGLYSCRSLEKDCDHHRRRCSAEYWRNHSMGVGSLMSKFAEHLGEDPWLYYVTGAVHDLDYVKFPHDRQGIDWAKSHPLPIALELIEMDVSPLICLAVLEHAPHLNLTPSSNLSYSLIACGDAVTFAAANAEINWTNDLPEKLVGVLKTAPRGNLQDNSVNIERANRIFDSLRALTWHTN